MLEVAKYGHEIRGLLSPELEPTKTTKNSHVSGFAPHCCKSSLLCGSHGTRGIAHQVCLDHYYYACVDITYAYTSCACYDIMCVCRCVRVSTSVYWCGGTPHFSFSYFCFALLAAVAVVSCRLYHKVPQALKFPPLGQLWYNISGTAILCGPLLTCNVCVDIAYICVCVLCVLWTCVYH